MAGMYFDCVNDNGGIYGQPIEYIAEEEQVDAAADRRRWRPSWSSRTRCVGIVGSTSLIECNVNGDYYAEHELLPDHRRRRPGLLHEPELLGRQHGARTTRASAAPRRPSTPAPRASSSSSRPNQPGFDLINSGVVEYAEENGMEGESILEDVPITDPAGLAQRLVQAAGDGGGVVLNFTGPTVLPLLQAIEQQGLIDSVIWASSTPPNDPSVVGRARRRLERQVPHQRRVQRARLRSARPEPHERGARAVRARRAELQLRPDGLPRRARRHRRHARDRG